MYWILTKTEKNWEEKIIIENLTKFVYFKDNENVGFIKFEQNITPPVDGILNGLNVWKLKLIYNMYYSDEYIKNMKKIFKN